MTQPATIPDDYAALIASDRVSKRTRAALLARAEPDDPDYQPVALPHDCFDTLRAFTARILPQLGAQIDLAQRLDAMLMEGVGDGWRFADLPPDRDAYAAGLGALDRWARATHGAGFAALQSDAQDAILADLADGRVTDAGPMSAPQLARWFEDVRADATRLYVAHPATMARIGYSGIAYGGDSETLPGFQALGPGAQDGWEPGA